MIKKSLLISLLIISSSFSLGLDDIISDTLKNSYDLQKISKNIQIADEDIKLSQKWTNPTLSLGINDIHFSDTLSRDMEPMQAQYIAINQIIPINNKLEYQKNIALEDKKIVQMDLENKKLQITSLIYEYAYDILIYEKKLSLIDKYQENTSELENVALSLYESGKVTQIIPLNAKLLNSKLEIQKENLDFKLKSTYSKLENLTYKKIPSIEYVLDLKEMHSTQNSLLLSHPVIKAIEYKRNKFENLAKLEQAKKYSDIKVGLGYFSRDKKYVDYVNLSFSMPLPIYGKENIKIAKAKYKSSQTLDELEITKTKFLTMFSILKNEMSKSYKNYEMLSQSMIPQREFIQENIEAHYSLSHMKSIDLFTNINQTIALEMLALDELAKYYSSYAKSFYFTGVK